MNTAIVIGATGLIGKSLIKRLSESSDFSQVLAISRKPTNFTDSKIRSLLFDFENWLNLEMQIKNYCGQNQIHGFCALGTTLKKAGSEVEFKKIDQDYVESFAKLLKNLGATRYSVVSVLGADPNSSIFYNKTKGEMEKNVEKLFSKEGLIFVRPSLLLGDRTEFRPIEKLSVLLSPVYSPILFGSLKKYKPIHADQVAKAMIEVSKTKNNKIYFENDELHRF